MTGYVLDVFQNPTDPFKFTFCDTIKLNFVRVTNTQETTKKKEAKARNLI